MLKYGPGDGGSRRAKPREVELIAERFETREQEMATLQRKWDLESGLSCLAQPMES